MFSSRLANCASRELALLRGAEEKRAPFRDRDVAFALATAARGCAIDFPHALIERIDLRGGKEIARGRGGPDGFVQPGEDEMRPGLVFGLGGREEMDAGVGMRAAGVARDAKAGRDFLQPAQEKRARENARASPRCASGGCSISRARSFQPSLTNASCVAARNSAKVARSGRKRICASAAEMSSPLRVAAARERR